MKHSVALAYFFRLFVCVMMMFYDATIAQAQQKQPNFVFIIADDIGYSDIGVYGNRQVKTPNIDRLAARGLRFSNAYVTTSSCSPSRCSIITGRYPHNTGAPELHDTLPAGQVMFPQLLQKKGYYTVLSGKNHMGPQVRNAFHKVLNGVGAGGEEEWVDLMKNRQKNKPFFFWFASNDAHRDWQVDDKAALYSPDSIRVPPMLYDGPATRADIASYYHEISRLDYFVGQLVKQLETEGLLENTYIIFTSDNGSPFPRNKVRLYDSGIRTPLIITGPGIRNRIDSSLVSTIDLAPTFLQLSGAALPVQMQGLSLTPLLNETSAHVRHLVFAEHNWHVFQGHERMVRWRNWVYIRNGNPNKQNLASESTRVFPAGKELWEAYDKRLTNPQQEDPMLVPRPTEELYNIAADPFQFNNLIANSNHDAVKKQLAALLDQWVEETGDSQPANPSPDREDVFGKQLYKNFKKGSKPGADRQAETITASGPVLVEKYSVRN